MFHVVIVAMIEYLSCLRPMKEDVRGLRQRGVLERVHSPQATDMPIGHATNNEEP